MNATKTMHRPTAILILALLSACGGGGSGGGSSGGGAPNPPPATIRSPAAAFTPRGDLIVVWAESEDTRLLFLITTIP